MCACFLSEGTLETGLGRTKSDGIQNQGISKNSLRVLQNFDVNGLGNDTFLWHGHQFCECSED